MHLVSYIDTQIARVTPLSVARIFGGLLPRLCSFMLVVVMGEYRHVIETLPESPIHEVE